jgi:hypothetical protein
MQPRKLDAVPSFAPVPQPLLHRRHKFFVHALAMQDPRNKLTTNSNGVLNRNYHFRIRESISLMPGLPNQLDDRKASLSLLQHPDDPVDALIDR